MPLVPIDDPADPRLEDYRHVPDPELLRRRQVFVAEGRQVVRTLLANAWPHASTPSAEPAFRPRSVLVTASALESLRDVIEPRLGALPVYVVRQGLVEALTGFNIHRGCLAIGERPPHVALEALLGADPVPRTLVVLEQVTNADNMGGIFRNAWALGGDAVVLGPHCCDPLYRKAIRTSMGAALRVRFGPAGAWPEALGVMRANGITVAALTPNADAVTIDEFARSWRRGERLALLAGSEGDGLSDAALHAADLAVRIAMAPGADSLNVATAVAVALHRLGKVTGRTA